MTKNHQTKQLYFVCIVGTNTLASQMGCVQSVKLQRNEQRWTKRIVKYGKKIKARSLFVATSAKGKREYPKKGQREINKMTGTNEKLGLPFDSMKKIIIAFDVDGTLITNTGNCTPDVSNKRIVDLLKILSTFKNIRIVVWSGGGKEYAERWVRLLGIEDCVWKVFSKLQWKEVNADIAIDDIQDTSIGKINLICREK